MRAFEASHTFMSLYTFVNKKPLGCLWCCKASSMTLMRRAYMTPSHSSTSKYPCRLLGLQLWFNIIFNCCQCVVCGVIINPLIVSAKDIIV